MSNANASLEAPLRSPRLVFSALPPVWAALALVWPAAIHAASPAAIDPCLLLSAHEVSAVMGQTVEPGQLKDNGVTPDGAYSTTCLWAVAAKAGVAPDPAKSLGGRSFAILNVMNWSGGPDDARKFLEDFRKAFETHDIDHKPVGIDVGADESIWWGDGVAARKGSVSFGISVASAGERDLRKPQAETLARLIAPRLAADSGIPHSQ